MTNDKFYRVPKGAEMNVRIFPATKSKVSVFPVQQHYRENVVSHSSEDCPACSFLPQKEFVPVFVADFETGGQRLLWLSKKLVDQVFRYTRPIKKAPWWRRLWGSVVAGLRKLFCFRKTYRTKR